jgi:UDP-N-acetylglucosamine--N-acetylmuramyl-(pentapeptide) pyrophosphoryl-undecaprenol N-acetylglucosamine transferase
MNPPTGPSNPRGAIIFAGGGTGGHIFPALAVAEALRDVAPHIATRFLCSTRAIDARILSAARITSEAEAAHADTAPGIAPDFAPIHAFPVGLRPRVLYRFVSHWGQSVRESRAHIRALREQTGGSVVIAAFGGFVAAPVVQAARVERASAALINLDAVPGRANRWIARRVAPDRIITAIDIDPSCALARAWRRVGPIVRRSGLAHADQASCRRALGLDPGTKTLLVTGGSQGAASINALLATLANERPCPLHGWQVLHQCGETRANAATAPTAQAPTPDATPEAQALRDAYARAGIRAVVVPFISAMGQAWGAADLAVSRSGAGSVAEAWANRVPTIFMPYPYHKDQHQRANAACLERAGACVVCTDAIDPRANAGPNAGPSTSPASSPGAAIRALTSDDARRLSLRAALERLGPADGAHEVARTLLGLLSA